MTNLTEREPERAVAEEFDTPAMLVDVDVHELLPSTDVLLEYMTPAWRDYFERYCHHFGPFAPSAMPYAHPLPAPGRGDWVDPNGPPPGTDLDTMRRHLFEEEGVSIGILCGISGYATLRGNY